MNLIKQTSLTIVKINIWLSYLRDAQLDSNELNVFHLYKAEQKNR